MVKFHRFQLKNIMQFFLIQLEIQSHEIMLVEMECISICNFPTVTKHRHFLAEKIRSSDRQPSIQQWFCCTRLHRKGKGSGKRGMALKLKVCSVAQEVTQAREKDNKFFPLLFSHFLHPSRDRLPVTCPIQDWPFLSHFLSSSKASFSFSWWGM